jgi:hypothetical protein
MSELHDGLEHDGPKHDEAEIHRRDAEMDALLRRSMAAPMPSLRADFDRRTLRRTSEGQRDSRSLERSLARYRRNLLAGYGLASGLASAVVMRGQGLNWISVAGSILVSAVLVATVAWVRRAGPRDSGPRSSGPRSSKGAMA